MTEIREVAVPVSQVSIRHKARHTFAVIGIPNSGKSTLFNRLTGLRQTTGNYPGVTVEKHVGTVELEAGAVNLIDLPGIYCLGGNSADERIAVDVLLGRVEHSEAPEGLLVVVDATHLYQSLYLVEQLLEMQLPVMVALTMVDVATASGISIDIPALIRRLGGVPVIPVTATSGVGLETLKRGLASLPFQPIVDIPESWPELSLVAQEFSDRTRGALPRIDAIQGMLHPGGEVAEELAAAVGSLEVDKAREKLFGSAPPQAEEARRRYKWVRQVMEESLTQAPLLAKFSARLQHWVNQPWPATLLFFAVLVLVFQAVFSWATPMMDAIDTGAAGLGSWVVSTFGENAFSSFIADGVIAGVGSVVVFLPQIMILFLFIIVLEDSGYLARAAFLMDRVMRTVGLSGQSVIPMLSSFACAIPAIMATRVIPSRKDRIATILAAPFMTCSARLPIYALMIAAFVPNESVGVFNLQGLVLFALYLLGIAGGLVTAWLLKATLLRGPKPHFTLALPEFRRPNLQTVAIKLIDRARIFLKRAGTVIFTVAVIIWALAYFPRIEETAIPVSATVAAEVDPEQSENEKAAAQLSQSWLGRAGRFVEPVFVPLGWDWRVSAAVIAGFPAREVVVAVVGTIYAVGSDADETRLSEKLKAATWPDGRAVFTLPMVLGMLVFYAWCLQCAATVATIRRETNSWRWPVFSWCYMTSIAYLGGLVVYQVGTMLTG